MDKRYLNKVYLNRIAETLKHSDLSNLNGKIILLSGATGLIGTFFVDTLLSSGDFKGKILANTTNKKKAQNLFSKWDKDKRLVFIEGDIKEKLEISEKVDVVIHAASYTDPASYAAHPVDTMLINIMGLKNMLDIAAKDRARVLVMSTTEVYGEARQSLPIKEEDYGYINPLQVRSAYNEAKRAAETLSIAYAEEYGLSITIARFSRVYGPTMKQSDTKAMAQFIKNALRGEDVVLKSLGDQIFSYIYVSDAVEAMIKLLSSGRDSEAYNVTNSEEYSLKEIAELVASCGGVNFRQELQDEYAGKGYSKATYAILDISKLKGLGFTPSVNLKTGISETLSILKDTFN